MKVKIGNQIFNSDNQPIMLILDDDEKELLRYMEKQNKICFYPYNTSISDVSKFMDEAGTVIWTH